MDENNIPKQQTNEAVNFSEEFRERQALKRAAWCIAIPALLFYAVSRFLAVIIMAAGGRLGFSAEQIRKVISDPAALQIIQVTLSVLLFTFPFILCAKTAGLNIGKQTALHAPKKETAVPYFLFGIGFCAFANIAVSQAGRIFESFGIHYSVPQDQNPEGFFGFMLVMLSTAFVPAITEEFAYRGIVMGLLKPFGEGFSVIASAAAFGMLHGNFNQIPFAFLVGLVLGYVRMKTGSLVVCMAIHFVNNAVAVVSSYSLGLPTAAKNTIYAVYIMLALAAAIYGVAKIGKDGFSFNPPQTKRSTKKTYVDFFFSPATLIFFALFFYRACTYLF